VAPSSGAGRPLGQAQHLRKDRIAVAMKTFVCVYLGSTFLALVVTPLIIYVARCVHAFDVPGIRAVHTKPIPRIGGVAIFLSAMSLIVSVLFLDNRIGDAFRAVRWELGSLLCMATFIFLIGLLDDLRGLPAQVKLAAEVMAAGVLCYMGVEITNLHVTDNLVLNLGVLSCPLTVLWIVGITNAVNLSDGLDGLAAGVSAVACAVIAIFAVHSENPIMAVFMLALLGGLSGFLVFNFNPAKVFMGDCGSLFLGFTIASSSVICLTKSSALVGLALPVLALGIPIFDTFFSMLRRFVEGRSLFAPDRSHFHHRLIDLGLQQRHAVIAIYAATCMAAGLGLFMMVRQDAWSLVVFTCILSLLVLLFRVVGAVRFRETLAGLQAKHALACRQRREKRAFEHLQLCFRQAHSGREWWQAVCEAAQLLELAWVSLRTINPDGSIDTSVWRGQGAPAKSSRIITVCLPIADVLGDRVMEVEIAVFVNGSLRSANHRAGLFSRLIDEHTSDKMIIMPDMLQITRPRHEEELAHSSATP